MHLERGGIEIERSAAIRRSRLARPAATAAHVLLVVSVGAGLLLLTEGSAGAVEQPRMPALRCVPAARPPVPGVIFDGPCLPDVAPEPSLPYEPAGAPAAEPRGALALDDPSSADAGSPTEGIADPHVRNDGGEAPPGRGHAPAATPVELVAGAPTSPAGHADGTGLGHRLACALGGAALAALGATLRRARRAARARVGACG